MSCMITKRMTVHSTRHSPPVCCLHGSVSPRLVARLSHRIILRTSMCCCLRLISYQRDYAKVAPEARWPAGPC